MVVLLLAGCGVFYGEGGGVDGTVEPDEVIFLDDDFELTESVSKGDTLGIDMPVPVKNGKIIVGASFDPALLRLDHFLEYAEDGQPRVQYLFLTMEVGATDVLVKMQPGAGGDTEIYKRITVSIEE